MENANVFLPCSLQYVKFWHSIRIIAQLKPPSGMSSGLGNDALSITDCGQGYP
jgi:hypothetical protein